MSWVIPKLWKDGECWIIGGGPSIPRQFGIPEDVISQVMNRSKGPEIYSPYLSPIQDRHVIGVNAAYLIGTWIDFIVFGDNGFYRKNRTNLLNYPKPVISVTKGAGVQFDSGIKLVRRHNKKSSGLVLDNPRFICWNGNSGASAINVAYHMGARRIILLGFDMNLDSNLSQHWHIHYASAGRDKKDKNFKKRLPFHRHLKGFPDIARDAKKAGVEILNVSPDSAIQDFPKVNLKEVL